MNKNVYLDKTKPPQKSCMIQIYINIESSIIGVKVSI